MKLTALPGEFSVWRLAADAPFPVVAPGAFLSLTRTGDELSLVSPSSEVPEGVTAETGFRCLKVEGPLPFEMAGVLASLCAPLAEAGIPIFVVSTFDTDYLLVKEMDLDRTCATLRVEGHAVDGIEDRSDGVV